MAKKDAFLLVSLEEEKARKLAAVVGNESCRKIINFLAEKDDSTETEIAKSLGLPLSTVHYNMQLLQQSGLASAEEFHYSTKGREVLHYKLANKYIIIAPKATAMDRLANKLKRILPVVAVVAAAGAGIQLYNALIDRGTFTKYYWHTTQIQEAVRQAAAPIATNETLARGVETGINNAISSGQNAALWFLAGAVFAITAYIIYTTILEKVNKK